MPHFHNNILVVTEQELVPDHYSSYDALKKAYQRSEKRGYGISRVQSGGNGRKLLIAFDSLPLDIREAIGDPRKGRHVLEQFYSTDMVAARFYADHLFPDRTHIKDETQIVYTTNASVLKAVQLLKAAREHEILTKNGTIRNIWHTLTSDTASFNDIIKKKFNVEHTLPENHRRFKDRYQRFLEEGYLSLINGNHKNKNAAKVTPELVQLLNSMFAMQRSKPTYTDISKQYSGFLTGYVEVINTDTGELYSPKEFKSLSRSTIYDYLSSWESRIGTVSKRSGNRQKLLEEFSPAHSQERVKYSGSIISVDDRQPPFEYEKGKRMWFYLAQDVASGAITTWVWGKSKEGIILDFYRQMVRNYAQWGLPLPAEIEAESSLNASFKNTFLRPGAMFQHVRIEANNARGKYIEPGFNRQVRYTLEKDDIGWIARPFAKDESNQEGSHDIPLIPYHQLVESRLQDIQTWNNMPHAEVKSKTRWEYFLENQHPSLQPINYSAILPHLGYKTQTSCHAGLVTLNGKQWLLGDESGMLIGEPLIAAMRQVEGMDLDIYWLDGNDGGIVKALVYLRDGNQQVCELSPKPIGSRATIEQTPETLKARQQMASYKATIDGYMRSQRNSLEPVAVVDNTPITLNSKFTIPGLQQRSYTERVAEVLPPPPIDDFNDVETVFNRPLRDRF